MLQTSNCETTYGSVGALPSNEPVEKLSENFYSVPTSTLMANLSQILNLWILVSCVALSVQDPIMTRETNSCSERNQPGLICETCRLLATCVNLSTGWLTVPVETCDTDNGFYCNTNLGSCSNITGPCHPFGYEGNFVCTSQGVFPDPYDCQKYHMCYVAGTTLVSANIECGGDKAYNVVTGECTLSLSDPSCNTMQYKCDNVGDAGAWPNNNNLFYICKATTNGVVRVLYPTLYRCGADERFDGQNCVKQGSVTHSTFTSNPSLPVTSLPPVTNNSPTLYTPTTAAPTLQCTSLGLQADPEDCHSYYYCSGLRGTLKHTTCPQGTYYNADLASCAIGNC